MATANSSNRGKNPSSDGIASLVREAVRQFAELSGQEPEQVSGLRPTEDGWSILVEVLDVERVPSTTSVLSTYRVDASSDGQLRGYERIRRYTRASTDSR